MSNTKPMNSDTLLKQAEKAKPPKSRRINMDDLAPIIARLRRNGFSYRAAWEWMKGKGIEVQPTAGGFTGAAWKAMQRQAEEKK